VDSTKRSAIAKIPSSQEIEKKLRLSFGLLEAAFEIKKFQLSKKYPEKSDQELSHMTMGLLEKGSL
jgi:hypothetical protein